MIRNLLVVCAAAAGVAACATVPPSKQAATPPPITPTQQYAATVTHDPDEVWLAPHAQGLSPRQVAALQDVVGRWREAEADMITIRAPANGGPEASAAVEAIRYRLEAFGVEPNLIRVVGYDAGSQTGAPVAVGFLRAVAHGPKCGQSWAGMTHTNSNEVTPEFGCAYTANIAALVANPEDLERPEAPSVADASRREDALEKYRKGETTSSAKDEQSTITLSTAVQ